MVSPIFCPSKIKCTEYEYITPYNWYGPHLADMSLIEAQQFFRLNFARIISHLASLRRCDAPQRGGESNRLKNIRKSPSKGKNANDA